jgi:hypothetical protein
LATSAWNLTPCRNDTRSVVGSTCSKAVARSKQTVFVEAWYVHRWEYAFAG